MIVVVPSDIVVRNESRTLLYQSMLVDYANWYVAPGREVTQLPDPWVVTVFDMMFMWGFWDRQPIDAWLEASAPVVLRQRFENGWRFCFPDNPACAAEFNRWINSQQKKYRFEFMHRPNIDFETLWSEVVAWTHENITGPRTIIHGASNARIFIRDKDEAMLFKMRWHEFILHAE